MDGGGLASHKYIYNIIYILYNYILLYIYIYIYIYMCHPTTSANKKANLLAEVVGWDETKQAKSADDMQLFVGSYIVGVEMEECLLV